MKKDTLIISNTEKYISQDLIKELFIPKKTTTVSKQITGNGATTSYLNLPSGIGTTDILIEPNRATVIEKEIDYKNGAFPKNKNIAFIYGGSTDRIDSRIKYDCIVLVVDSFNDNMLNLIRLNIRYILIDEQHTIELNASFRKKAMFDLNKNLARFKDAAITTITATPNLFYDVDISIKNDVKPTKLFLSRDILESIDRVVLSIEQGNPTFIFTNDHHIIKYILKRTNRTDFNFKGGDSLKSKLCSKGFYTFSETSNITFCTSAFFEGWSSHVKGGMVFMFTSYDSNYNAMLGSNIYQSIGRLREGSTSSELCIFNTRKSVKYHHNLLEVLEHFKGMKAKVTTKQRKGHAFDFKGVRYTRKELQDFIYFRTNSDGTIVLHILYDAVKIHLEQYKASIDFETIYADFFQDRNVSIINLENDNPKKRQQLRVTDLEKIQHLLFTLPNNKDIIEMSLYPFQATVTKAKLISLLNVNIAVRRGLGLDNRTEISTLDLISSNDFEKDLLNVSIAYGLKTGKHTKKETRDWFKDSNILDTCYNIVYHILSKNAVYNRVGFREFNQFVLVNNDVLTLIAKGMGIGFSEIDVKEEYPTILYSMFGLDKPENIYGTDRTKDKITLNTMLNNLHSKHNQKIKAIQNSDSRNSVKLRKHFPDEIVKYLISEYGGNNKDSSKFYDLMTYHEQKIINQCKDRLCKFNDDVDGFMLARKHDALLIFHTDNLEFNYALSTEYLGRNNWFKLTRHLPTKSDVFKPLTLGLTG